MPTLFAVPVRRTFSAPMGESSEMDTNPDTLPGDEGVKAMGNAQYSPGINGVHVPDEAKPFGIEILLISSVEEKSPELAMVRV